MPIMVAKIAFLVLLGTTFVLATPEAYVAHKDVKTKGVTMSKLDEIFFDLKWEKLKYKCSKALDIIAAEWAKIKDRRANIDVKAIEKKAMLALAKAKEAKKLMLTKQKVPDFKIQEIKTLIKELRNELNYLLIPAYEKAKVIVNNVVIQIMLELRNEY